MKRNKLIFILALFSLFCTLSGLTASAKTITKNAEVLYGKEDTFQFDYYLQETKSGGSRELFLQWDQSELLKKPSAFTVQLDNENIQTIPLDASNNKKELTIKLPKNSQKKGSHTVKVLFSGVIKEGVCVDQNTSANWFKILPSSKLKIEGAVENAHSNFENFSSQFSNGRTDVVISNEASEDVVNAAALLASNLQRASEQPNLIKVVQEKDWDQKGDFIIAFSEPNKSYTGDLKGFLRKNEQDDFLQASLNKVKNKTVLTISTNKEGTLTNSMTVFTEPQLLNQLSGTEFSMEQMPELSDTKSNEVKLKDIPLADQKLSNHAEQSSFDVYIPKKLNQEKKIQLQLLLKKSTLLNSKHTELVVTINGTPFALKLDEIQSTGLTTKTISIDPKQIDLNQPLNVQLQLNGAQSLDPCETTNHNNWLYISNESFFTFLQSESTNDENVKINDFPMAFNQSDDPTIVQIPKIDQQNLNQLVALYRASYTGKGIPQYKLLVDDQVKELKEKTNRILLGDLERNPLLQKSALLKAQFIPENAKILASLKQTNNHELELQIYTKEANLKSSELYKFLQQMTFLKNDATVMVQAENKQVFTNEQQIRTDGNVNKGVKNSEQTSNTSLIMTFVGLILLIIIIVFLLSLRRKKKK